MFLKNMACVSTPARLGLGSARPGPARLGPARPGSARLGLARLGLARLGSARPGLTNPSVAQKVLALPNERIPSCNFEINMEGRAFAKNKIRFIKNDNGDRTINLEMVN